METLLVEIYLPAAEKSFDMRLPVALNSLLAARMAAEAISELSDGTYLSSHSSLLAKRDSGRILELDRSLEENNVHNGSRLILL